ncbi:hypothetical protein ACFQZ2_08250 [Streptomonospora algeriensis]|uniref:Secreted protein n=1 Tax=Streptomonospora algeriensis TaxID=995084 RepID=A0ABW3BFH7_9ACTN
MVAAIIGLVGATLGAVITLVGSALSERRQDRRQERIWLRDRRTEAYDGALRHLLRAANIRSTFSASGPSYVAKEHAREHFEDLVQAQFWMHALLRYCGSEQEDRLAEAARELDTQIVHLNSGESSFRGREVGHYVEVVSECARQDQRMPNALPDGHPTRSSSQR